MRYIVAAILMISAFLVLRQTPHKNSSRVVAIHSFETSPRATAPNLNSRGPASVQTTAPKQPRASVDVLKDILGPKSERIFKLFELTQKIQSGGADAHRSYLESLRKSPSYADDLLAAFDKLHRDDRFLVETAGLLRLLENSGLPKDQLNKIGEDEMMSHPSTEVPMPKSTDSEEEKNLSNSTNQEMLVPVIAHQLFLNTASNDQIRFDGTIRAIEFQANHNVRTAMFEAYCLTNPARRNEMLNALSERNVDMVMDSE